MVVGKDSAAAVASRAHLAQLSARESAASTFTLEEAFEVLGHGKTQIFLFFFVGIAWAGDGMEMMLLSYLGPEVRRAACARERPVCWRAPARCALPGRQCARPAERCLDSSLGQHGRHCGLLAASCPDRLATLSNDAERLRLAAAAVAASPRILYARPLITARFG